MKNILYIGNSGLQKGGLDYSLYNSFKKYVNVDFIYAYENKWIYKNRFKLYGRILNRLIDKAGIKELSLYKKLKNIDINKYDVIFVSKGMYITTKTIRYLRKFDCKLVCFNPDDPYNKASSNKNIVSNIKNYDLYFIWSKSLQNKIIQKEKIKSVYLPFAVDFSLYNKFQNVEKKYPITFIGNWDNERENWLEKIENKNNLYLFGNNWGYKLQNSKLRDSYTGFSVVNERFFEVVNQSIINLNILRLQNKNSNNMRTFEILGCGGFQLHEYSKEVANLFEESKEIEFFRDSEELNNKIEFYLKNPNIADKIGKLAYKKIIKDNHTYDNRVKKILKAINEL